jgi:hypothetical protein
MRAQSTRRAKLLAPQPLGSNSESRRSASALLRLPDTVTTLLVSITPLQHKATANGRMVLPECIPSTLQVVLRIAATVQPCRGKLDIHPRPFVELTATGRPRSPNAPN